MITRVPKVRRQLWIGTADIKDLYVGERLIHAKEQGPNFREDFDRYPNLFSGLERVLCPRVHFKLIIFDLSTAYIGSANLTGAGLQIYADHGDDCGNLKDMKAGMSVWELYNGVTDYASNNALWAPDDNRRGLLQGEALNFLLQERDIRNYKAFPV